EDLIFPDGTPYFKNYVESFWQLYILVTTANNPDVMMPAYDSNKWYCLFFTIYIILCLYLMLNILLAVTYNSYRECMKNQIKRAAYRKKSILHQAFEMIKINVDGKEMVTYKTWVRLIRLAHPGKTKHQIDLLMMVLDTDKTGFISRCQFLNIANLLNVPISVVSERKTFMEIYVPRLYSCKISKLIRAFVDTIYFSLSYDLVVVANVALICLNIDDLDWAFVALYLIEILLKWYTYGTKRYFHHIQNWTDVLITLMSLTVLIVVDFNLTGALNPEALSVLNVFRIIFDAVFNVSFSILTYCIVFYCFAVIGMEVFSLKVHYLGYNNSAPTEEQLNCNNPALNGSVYSANRYCSLNFNDVISSLVLLAALLIGNNWHVICDGFVQVTSIAARIYFMSFHLCVAVVVMNIVTAFILDMFMYEYTFSKKGHIDTKVEQTIKNLQLGIDDETGMDITKDNQPTSERRDSHSMFHTKSMFRKLTMRNQLPTTRPNLTRYDGIRFHIKKRGWTKTEQLLQQLFELEEEHEHEHDHDDDYKLRSLSISEPFLT
ncbi:TPC1-like protein, partial [Mya arenaria]